jgi:GAF domain-containing protein
MSATPDNTLANPEQLVADLQRQLSECKAERDEALQRETATAEVLEVINSSPGNLAPIFDAILEKTLRICSATFGAMASHDNGRLTRVAARGLPAAFNKWRLEHPVLQTPSLQRLLAGEAVVHEPDLMTGEAYRQGNPDRRALVDLGGARSAVTVALRNDDALHGAIMIFRQEVRPFSDKEIRLLQNFEAQAVVAMENARLLTESREALQQQAATAEVLQIINSSPGDLAPVFDSILEKAHALCGVEFGSLELYDGGKFRSVAMRGLSGPVVELLRQPFEPKHGLPSARLVDGAPIVQISDLAVLARQRTDDPSLQAAVEFGLRSTLFVPLRRGGTLCGLI